MEFNDFQLLDGKCHVVRKILSAIFCFVTLSQPAIATFKKGIADGFFFGMQFNL